MSRVKYCEKENNDFQEIANMCKSKVPISEIKDKFPSKWATYSESILSLYDYYVEDRNFKPHVEIHFGLPGAGKTRYVYDNFKDVYSKPNYRRWDGYEYNDTVIIDNYDGYINFKEFLQVINRYPHRVPIKGGFRKFVSKNIIFTSNINPKFWYPFLDSKNTIAMFKYVDVIKEYK